MLGLLAAKGAAEKPLTRDVIFAAVADEESGCAKGSMFLVDEHPDAVRAEYVLGEIGAFSLPMLGRTFYPIQVAEKGMCWVRATFKGRAGARVDATRRHLGPQALERARAAHRAMAPDSPDRIRA